MFLPDWRGQTVVIAASGPSQRQEDIEAARDKAVVVVINETWRLAPWADALYACDARWWRARGPGPSEFGGLRFIGHGEHAGCIPCGVRSGDDRMRWCGTRIGAGGNSGFQAINLAAASGARRIVLLGFDMGHSGGAVHWHADHERGLSNPDAAMLRRCAATLDRHAPVLAQIGVEVINASRETALSSYARLPIMEAI